MRTTQTTYLIRHDGIIFRPKCSFRNRHTHRPARNFERFVRFARPFRHQSPCKWMLDNSPAIRYCVSIPRFWVESVAGPYTDRGKTQRTHEHHCPERWSRKSRHWKVSGCRNLLLTRRGGWSVRRGVITRRAGRSDGPEPNGPSPYPPPTPSSRTVAEIISVNGTFNVVARKLERTTTTTTRP